MGREAADSPASWGELLNSYRQTAGSRSLATVAAPGAAPAVRYTRSVPGICPLAEVRHALYAVGVDGSGHAVSAADGSLQRSQWHGWGDTSLLKEEGFQGQPHPRGLPRTREGRKAVPEPGGRGGGRGMLALLQGEAGDSSSGGGTAVTAGRRAVAAPTDKNKRDVSFGQLLAQTAPASPDADAWIGHISIDPAKGKGWAPDPSHGRGADLFDVLQQRALQQQPGGGGGQAAAANADAWIGNRLIGPSTGKKAVEGSDASQAHLHAATFKAGPPADMPRIGKRPLPVPTSGCVNAAQTLRMEDPLPSNVVVPKPVGKAMVLDPHHLASSSTTKVDIYAAMTYAPLSDTEASRYTHAWNDAAVQPRRKPVASAAAAATAPQGVAAALRADTHSTASATVRYVPRGGLAQEQGFTIDDIARQRLAREGGGGGSRSTSGGKALGATGRQQEQHTQRQQQQQQKRSAVHAGT